MEWLRTPEMLELMNAGLLYMAGLLYREPAKSDHPPPFRERQVPLAPIIFRTKNTEKSRLGLIGKNFGKNLWENVSGKGKPPILWRGGETLK